MILFNILLWILIIFFLIMVAVIFLPVYYKAEGKIGAKNEITAKAGWFPFIRVLYNYTPDKSGLVIKIGPFKIPTDNIFSDKPKKKDKKEKQKFKMTDAGALIKNADNNAVFLSVTLIKKICGKILPRHFRINGIVGFGDPFTTVKLMGMYEAVSCSMGFKDKIRIQGDYGEQRFDFDFKLSGRFAIASLMWPVIWFMFQKPVRKLMKASRIKNRRDNNTQHAI